MSAWIDWHALGQIVGVGLLAGAGLPALFALGLRALAGGDTAGGADGVAVYQDAGPVRLTAAGLCFAVVLAAVGYGIYLIVAGS